MDWKRVKTILIIALLFVNALLLYTILEDKEADRYAPINRQLIIELLEEHNITVDEEILDLDMDISNVTLKLQSYDLQSALNVFEEYSDYGTLKILSPSAYILQSKQLTFTTYAEDESLPINELSDEMAIEKGKDLISQLGFQLDDIYVKKIGHTGKKTILTFGQIIDGHSLDDSYTVIKYNNEHLLEFSRVWYDAVETSEVKKEFYSPEYALYKFVGEVYDKQPNRERALEIETMNLVYRLSANDVESLDDLVLEGEAFIKWEITTKDNKSYLINALID